MNRALLAELQRLTCYPSVTILQWLREIANKAGGEAVIVPAGDLSHLDRVGAVLRY